MKRSQVWNEKGGRKKGEERKINKDDMVREKRHKNLKEDKRGGRKRKEGMGRNKKGKKKREFVCVDVCVLLLY